MALNATPEDQIRAKATEDFVQVQLEQIGLLTRNLQRGFDGPSSYGKQKPLLTPDIEAIVRLPLGGIPPQLFEVKTFTPTRYETFGFSPRALRDHRQFATNKRAELWIVVQDQSISTDITDLSSYLIAENTPALLKAEGGKTWQGFRYIHRKHFSPFSEWLESMRDEIDEEEYRQENIISGHAEEVPITTHIPMPLLGCKNLEVRCNCGGEHRIH